MRSHARRLISYAAASIACMLAGWAALPALASSGAAMPAAVTARPPLEAVPAAPVTRAQLARAHQCEGWAKTKRLHGEKRAAYVKSCMALPRAKASHASR